MTTKLDTISNTSGRRWTAGSRESSDPSSPTLTTQTLTDAELEIALQEFERTDRMMGFFLCIAALIAAVSVGMLVL